MLDALLHRAAQLGLSAPKYLRRETEQNADRLIAAEWVERTRRRPMPSRAIDTLATLEELRGPRPA